MSYSISLSYLRAKPEVSQGISQKILQATQNKKRDISLALNMTTKNEQYDNVNTLEKVCHTERSEVSKNPSANVQNPLDISVSTKPQYDKVSGSNLKSSPLPCGVATLLFPLHCERKQSNYFPILCGGGLRGWV